MSATLSRVTEPLPSRLISPTLLLAAVIWLLASWFMNAVLDSARLLAVVDGELRWDIALEPTARGLLISIVLGGMLAWPAWRLSQPAPRLAGAQLGADLMCLIMLIQVVVWPLRVGVRWPLERAATIDLTLVAWLMAAALVTWVGWLKRTPLARTLAMVGCVLLVGGGYLVTLVTGYGGAARLTPITMIWMLAQPQRGSRPPDLTAELLALLLVIVAGWAYLLHRESRGHGRHDRVMMD